MKNTILLILAGAMAVPAWTATNGEIPGDYQKVLETLGKKGDYKDQVLKINIPRNDIHVNVEGVATPTPFGFGGWLAMTKGNGGMDVMMGDLVLLEKEVNPVMSALLDHGLEVTALHNHFLFEQPRIFYMHVHGHGKAEDLAQRAKPAVELIGHIAGDPPASGGGSTLGGSIDTSKIAQITGHQGQQNGPVYKITVGRDDLNIREMNATINSRMGLNTWAAFIGSDQDAAVAGDVAMVAHEITPVLKALRSHNIDVVSVHQHMTTTQPTIFFLHYWGRGPAAKLAEGFKAALDELGRKASH